MSYKISEMRKKKGITQDELAKRSGVSRAIVSGLESGRITITTTQTLVKLARALNCTVQEIFFDESV